MAGFADVKIGTNINEWLNEIAFITSEMSHPTEPQTFQQAWWHPDLTARATWWDGTSLEFNKMISIGIWRKVGSTSIPSGRRLVGCHWLFKIKCNGVYQARLAANEFSQIPGLDFTDNFSPVVNNVTFSVVITCMIIKKWDAKVVDIDNVFLYGEVEHEIYMVISEGYAELVEQCEEDEALKLEKAIYGFSSTSKAVQQKNL